MDGDKTVAESIAEALETRLRNCPGSEVGCTMPPEVAWMVAWKLRQPDVILCQECAKGRRVEKDDESLCIECGGVEHDPEWYCADGEWPDQTAG